MRTPAQTRPGTALGSITGLGLNRPSPNAPLARRVTGSDVTGVTYRVQADSGVTTASLAAGAARAALKAANANPADVEMVLVGTTTPDVMWPSTACLVQTDLGLPMVGSFDLYAAETSVLTALDVAVRYVAAGIRSVLVIGAESDNQLVDLPGQGGMVHARAAGAMVLTPALDDGGVLATTIGGAARPQINADGQDRILLQGLSEGVFECLRKADLNLADVDLVIAEQSAPEIMRAWSKHHGVDAKRLRLDPSRYGSLLAAAPLVALHDAVVEQQLRDGMTALLISCGTGPVWAAACLRWSGGRVAQW